MIPEHDVYIEPAFTPPPDFFFLRPRGTRYTLSLFFFRTPPVQGEPQFTRFPGNHSSCVRIVFSRARRRWPTPRSRGADSLSSLVEAFGRSFATGRVRTNVSTRSPCPPSLPFTAPSPLPCPTDSLSPCLRTFLSLDYRLVLRSSANAPRGGAVLSFWGLEVTFFQVGRRE